MQKTEYGDFAGSGKTVETKTRKTPVPKSYERILAGAKKLSLTERVEMIKELQAENDNEVSDLIKEGLEAKERAEKATALVNGKE